MPQFSPAYWPIALCALAALPAFSQTSALNTETVAKPKTAATATTVSATIPYQSAFEGYQPFSDEKLHLWKDSNSRVEKIGGWRAYAKEASEPVATKPQTSPTAIPTPASPHSGHGKH